MPSFSEAESSRFEAESAANAEKEQIARATAVSEIEESFIKIQWLSVNWGSLCLSRAWQSILKCGWPVALKLTTDGRILRIKIFFGAKRR